MLGIGRGVEAGDALRRLLKGAVSVGFQSGCASFVFYRRRFLVKFHFRSSPCEFRTFSA